MKLDVAGSHGRNPMRYDCQSKGCFNLKRRPKIEEFAESLPGRIAFSDVDAITEVAGHFLLLEWKSYQGELPIGQRIMFERMTSNTARRFTVLIVVGDAETMEVESIALIFGGRNRGFESSSLEDVKERIAKWAAWALRQRGRRIA